MAHTEQQFAIFNIPINPEEHVEPVDKWLFEFPVKTFDIGTPKETILRTYNAARNVNHGNRVIGQAKIESRLILKVRHVHYTDWAKVVGADTVKEPKE